MKIVFLGAVNFSEACLRKLISMNAEIVAVGTLSRSTANADHCDLSSVAIEHGIPFFLAPEINTKANIDRVQSYNSDYIFCFGWPRLLSAEVLSVPRIGVVGYHPSALPKNRGRHPLVWALVLGLSETGSTFFLMDEGIDSGDIISQKLISISPDDDASSLYSKVTTTALEQLEDVLVTLESSVVSGSPQVHSQANSWRKRSKIDGRIDWRMSATSIYNLVRGLANPYVGAHFEWQGEDYKVWRARPIRWNERHIEPGKVVASDANGVIIKTGQDAIQLISIEPIIQLPLGTYL